MLADVFEEGLRIARYRALAFGKPVAPWQATYELAAQSAIKTDNAHREPRSGRVYLSPGVEIKEAAGDVPLTGDLALWAEALAILRTHMFGAEDYIEAQIVTAHDDRQAEARWRLIGKRIAMVRAAAGRDEGAAASG